MAIVNGHGNGYPWGQAGGDGFATPIAPGDRPDGPFRKPPHNLDAERGLIGSVLIDNGALAEVREIATAEDFFRDSHQVLWRAICGLADRGVGVDGITLAEELRRRDQFEAIGGLDMLAAVFECVPHAANARHYAEIVRQHAIRRAAIEQLQETIQEAYNQSCPAEQLVSRAGDRIARIGHEEEDPVFEGLKPWPDPPDPAIYHGLAGEILRLIAPHSESDPMAILGQLLVGFGNLIGRRAHWRVESTRHHTNLFLCVVGNSSKARKGTSWDHVTWLLRACDEDWSRQRILKGLSSGEGLIWAVRDPILRREKVGGVKQLGGGGYQDVEVDPGVEDKRALFIESEFGGVLSAMNRDGNTLSGIVRQAWDSGDIGSSTKNNPARATGAHISIIGHITAEELHRRLTSNDAANGFANRFLWLCARRSQFLPHGGRIYTVNFNDVVRQLREAVEFGRMEFEDDGAPMLRDGAANALWEEVYPVLSEPKPGLLGSVTSRAEAQAMRVACVYALLDRSKWIRRHHLEAGLAFWHYCEQSAAYIFGDALGDPDAEKLLSALRDSGGAGLTLKQIRREVFRGHRNTEQIAATLTLLARSGLAAMEVVPGTRRPTTIWKYVQRKC